MIVDLHTHISTKPMFIKNNKNCEEAYNFLAAFPIDEVFAEDALDSQSSLSQIRKGGGNIIVNPIYSLERSLARIGLIYGFLSQLTLTDENVLCGIADGRIQNFAHTGKEIRLVEQTATFTLPNGNDSINILTKQNNNYDPNTVNVIHALEGLHGAINTEREFRGQYQTNAFLHRFKILLDRLDPLYVTLSHLTYNGLFNYPFGMKMSSKKNRSWFLPCNCGFDGITGLRKEILDMMRQNGALIDLKHLSLGNRLAMYQYAHHHNIPLMLSHGAVTGLTIADYFSLYKAGAYKNFTVKNGKPFHNLLPDKQTCKTIIPRAKGVYNRWFNSSQLNIMDEEIVMIMKLGGIIGLIMDKRVLGSVKLKDLANNRYMDYLSPEDVPYIYDNYQQTMIDFGIDGNYQLPNTTAEISALTSKWVHKDNDISKSDERSQSTARADIERFCQQVLHIIQVGKANGISNPENFIAIGSDYDGLISAIKCARTAADMSSFREIIRAKLKEHKNDPTSILKKHNIGIDRLTDGIFGENALRFLRHRGRVSNMA